MEPLKDDGGEVMKHKVVLKATIPVEQQGQSLSTRQELHVKRLLDATQVQYQLLALGEDWDHIDTVMDTVIVYREPSQ